MPKLRTEWAQNGWTIQFSNDDKHYLIVSPLEIIVQRFVCCLQAVTYAEVIAQEDYDARNNFEFDPYR